MPDQLKEFLKLRNPVIKMNNKHYIVISCIFLFLLTLLTPCAGQEVSEDSVHLVDGRILIIDDEYIENVGLSEIWIDRHHTIHALIELNEPISCHKRIVVRAKYSILKDLSIGHTYKMRIFRNPINAEKVQKPTPLRECYSGVLAENGEWIYELLDTF